MDEIRITSLFNPSRRISGTAASRFVPLSLSTETLTNFDQGTLSQRLDAIGHTLVEVHNLACYRCRSLLWIEAQHFVHGAVAAVTVSAGVC